MDLLEAEIVVPLYQPGKPCYVYVIRRSDTCHKVGRSRSPRHRCKMLQAGIKGAELKVVAQAYRPTGDGGIIERLAHSLLRDKKTASAEWYDATEKQAIRAIARAIAAVELDRTHSTIKTITAEP